jgi:hypothetical protein
LTQQVRTRPRRLFVRSCWNWLVERLAPGADAKISTLNKIRRALETAGVRFIDEDEEQGPGVRLQKGKPAGKRK